MSIQIKALTYQALVVGYRCILPDGVTVDVSKEALNALGIKPRGITTKIPLYDVDGQLRSKSEVEHQREFDDISDRPDSIQTIFTEANSDGIKKVDRKISLDAARQFAEKVLGLSLEIQLVTDKGHPKGRSVALFVRQGVKIGRYSFDPDLVDGFVIVDDKNRDAKDDVFVMAFPDNAPRGLYSETGVRNGVFTIAGYDNRITDADIDWMVERSKDWGTTF